LRPASLYAVEEVVLIPLTIVGLAPEMTALAMRWRRKREFHVTALTAKRVSPWAEVEAELSRHEIREVRLLSDRLRLVLEDGNRTLVAMAEVDGLAELYRALSRRLGTEIPPPPAHVTLYTNPGGEGIGLHDSDDLRELTRPLEPAELEEVRRASGLDRLA
jgi:hypothetical protein